MLTNASHLRLRPEKGTLLAYSPDAAALQELAGLAATHGFNVQTTGRAELAVQILSEKPFDVCLVDECRDTATTQRLAEAATASARPTTIVRLVTHSDGVGSHGGRLAFSYTLEKPYSAKWLATVLDSACERTRLTAEVLGLRRQLENNSVDELIGATPAADTLRERTKQFAVKDGPVLICGEPGAGLDLVAQAVHCLSRRAPHPLVKLDCSLLSSECLERELFGSHCNGSRTAEFIRPGRLEQTCGGTVVLENIDQVALPLQKKLLNACAHAQRHSTRPTPAGSLDVRLIATSHRDLRDRAGEGRFHRDLLACLTANVITVPPLRDRREDLAMLSERILKRLAVREGRPIRALSLEALQIMQRYEWPGNLSELWNVLDRACSIDMGHDVTAAMITPWLAGKTADESSEVVGISLKDMERKLIETTFARCGGNRERTAGVLRIGLRTLSGKLREYGYPPRGGPGSNRKSIRLKAA